MSGNHLLHYVLTKKPSYTEYGFILNMLSTLIQNEIEIDMFFQNEQQFGVFVSDEFHMHFATLIDMQELPESSKDQAVIRLLGDKNKYIKAFDEQDSRAFMSRFFTRYIEEEKIDLSACLHGHQEMGNSHTGGVAKSARDEDLRNLRRD
jgi:hypothetical protein